MFGSGKDATVNTVDQATLAGLTEGSVQNLCVAKRQLPRNENHQKAARGRDWPRGSHGKQEHKGAEQDSKSECITHKNWKYHGNRFKERQNSS